MILAAVALAGLLGPWAGIDPSAPVELWRLEGAASYDTVEGGGALGCAASAATGALRVHVVWAGTVAAVAWEFQAADAPCDIVRACLATGGAATGWRGACPDPWFIIGSVALQPQPDGAYSFLAHFSAPIGATWSVRGLLQLVG